jgi:Ca2+-binding RTX toxin-like protein
MNSRFAGALVLFFSVAAMPVSAGTVRLSGSSIVFDANAGEVNTLVVNGRGAGFDQSTGQFVSGVTITDSTANLVAQAPCRKFIQTVVCDPSGIGTAVIHLGNKNDSVRLDFNGDGPVLTMNVDGGLGDDTILGGPAADTLDGGPGDDTINGGAGADVITGGLGVDTITGRDGVVDNINCGLGRDILTGDANDVLKRCE